MRVITGKARGRRLREPKGSDVRPTTDMVKEAVFNILQSDIEGARALDLFCGTGQLGIEALSRGAADCVFVDAAEASLKLTRENLKLCGFEARVVRGDAVGFLEYARERFDIVFLDPPYDAGLLDKALHTIENIDILSQGGIIICESRVEKALPELAEPFSRVLERRYGKVKITVYVKGK